MNRLLLATSSETESETDTSCREFPTEINKVIYLCGKQSTGVPLHYTTATIAA